MSGLCQTCITLECEDRAQLERTHRAVVTCNRYLKGELPAKSADAKLIQGLRDEIATLKAEISRLEALGATKGKKAPKGKR